MTGTPKLFACTAAAVIPASPEEVFDALTNARTLRAWTGQKGRVAPQIGGAFSMFEGWVHGKVLAFERGKALACTWRTDDMPEGTPPTVVVYQFTRTAKGTRLTVKHSGFVDRNEMTRHKSGWTEFVFTPLKDYFSQTGRKASPVAKENA